MKIYVTGTRGIPDIPGGVETHCENLYPFVVKNGHTVRLSRRKRYAQDDMRQWKNVELEDIYNPESKSLEAIVHTFLALISAKRWGADIVHIHAIGPALLAPVGRLMGMKVVVTHHGPDYQRGKWGKLAKGVLIVGEMAACRFASRVIVISDVIKGIVSKRGRKNPHLVYNGVDLPERSKKTDYLDSLGVATDDYILAVGRFVQEKGFHDLIDAYSCSGLSQKLVLVGDADYEDEYSIGLKKSAASNSNIIMTGYITGEPLNQVYTNAKLFVLPSYHEGLPIVLLEALSYGLCPLVSDIPANKEIGLQSAHYFKCGDRRNLKAKLVESVLRKTVVGDKYLEMIREKYNWANIAQQTVSIYNQLCKTA